MSFCEFLPNFCRSAEETIIPEEAHIKSDSLSFCKGTLILTGPAKWDFNGFTLNHWFDGCCMVSKFTILPEEKVVKLQKKYLRTEYFNSLMKNGKPLVMSFGTRAFRDEENKNFISRLLSNYIVLGQIDNCSSIIHVSDKTFTTTGESCYCHPIDMNNLDVVPTQRVDLKNKGVMNLLSHAQQDAQGNLYNMGLSVSAYGGCRTTVIKISNPKLSRHSNKHGKNCSEKPRMKDLMKKAEFVSSWPNRHPTAVTFSHSFGMSENYVIYVEQPYYTSLLNIVSSTVKGQSYKDILQWHSEEKNRFIIMDKRTDTLFPLSITSKDPFFSSHFINCYEEDDHIIVDLIGSSDSSLFDVLSIAKFRNKILMDSAPTQALRFVIPLISTSTLAEANQVRNLVTLKSDRTTIMSAGAYKDGTNSMVLIPEILTQRQGIEAPTTNPNFVGKSYSIFYTGHTFQSHFFGHLGKFNVRTRECEGIWKGEAHHGVGQPVFIPRPQSQEEDDGVILAGVTSGRDDVPSFILFLDAKSFKEITRVEFNTQIPLHMHSYFWTPDLVDCS